MSTNVDIEICKQMGAPQESYRNPIMSMSTLFDGTFFTINDGIVI